MENILELEIKSSNDKTALLEILKENSNREFYTAKYGNDYYEITEERFIKLTPETSKVINPYYIAIAEPTMDIEATNELTEAESTIKAEELVENEIMVEDNSKVNCESNCECNNIIAKYEERIKIIEAELIEKSKIISSIQLTDGNENWEEKYNNLLKEYVEFKKDIFQLKDAIKALGVTKVITEY